MAVGQELEAVFETNTAGLLYLKDPLDLTKDVVTQFEKQEGKGKGNVAKKQDEDGKGDAAKKEKK
jgi:outer membrane protein